LFVRLAERRRFLKSEVFAASLRTASFLEPMSPSLWEI
jgi:hypothetical protein